MSLPKVTLDRTGGVPAVRLKMSLPVETAFR